MLNIVCFDFIIKVSVKDLLRSFQFL